jgi:hypothetical protein
MLTTKLSPNFGAKFHVEKQRMATMRLLNLMTVGVLLGAAVGTFGCGKNQQNSLFGIEGNSKSKVTVYATGTTTRLLTVDSAEPRRTDGTQMGRAVTWLDAADTEVVAAPGQPALPVKRLLVIAPEGMGIARFELVATDDSADVTLAHDLAYQAEPLDHTQPVPTRDDASYTYPHGDVPLLRGDVEYVGSQQVQWLTVYPYAYDPRLLQLTWRKTIQIAVEFEPLLTGFAPTATASVLQALAINPEDVSQATSGRHLLIVDAALATAAEPLAELLMARGQEVATLIVEDESAAQIKERILNANRTSALQHVTLVGSIDMIPAVRTSSVWTDVGYSQLDSGSAPDLSIGRIPAQTPAELTQLVAKLSARRDTPRGSDRYLLTAGSDTSLGCPANVDRIGGIIAAARPEAEVEKLYRVNGASKAEIVEGYNTNPNLVVYDGHGDHRGMQEIPLLMDDVPALANARGAIVLDIACLNANWPSSGASRRNFAETILLSSETGVAGIVAAGGNSGGHSFFRDIVSGVVGDMIPDEIGLSLLAARIRASSTDNYMFGFYGDPSSPVFAE